MLDEMILHLETQLGKPHTVSPFANMYQRHGISSQNQPAAAPKEEEKKAEPVKKQEDKKEEEPKKQAKKEKPKKEEKKEEPKKAAPAAGELSPEEKIYQDFSFCDLRVGKIVECDHHPESDYLFIEKIDIGEAEPRVIGSGLRPQFTREQMMEDLVIVFANLKPRKLGGIMSNGMVMCAGNADHTKFEFIRPPPGAKVGDRVQIQGNKWKNAPLPDAYEPILNPKKKIEVRYLELLKTDAECFVTYNDIKLVIGGEPVKAQTLANVSVA